MFTGLKCPVRLWLKLQHLYQMLFSVVESVMKVLTLRGGMWLSQLPGNGVDGVDGVDGIVGQGPDCTTTSHFLSSVLTHFAI